MEEILKEREEKIHRFFNLKEKVELLNNDTELPKITPEQAHFLKRHNIEWHIIPAENSIPVDEPEYRKLFYPMYRGEIREYLKSDSYHAIYNGHRKHKGRILGIETTIKPRYLPENRQFYGTPYGFDASADPFSTYFGNAAIVNGTRFGHNYTSLHEFVKIVNNDWEEKGMLPEGYHLTICPPVVFNFIGTIFYPEWSQTESLEIGFYRDSHGNAKCYAVGSNRPNDFSYIHEISSDSDWTLLGFRLALVPNQ